MFYRDDVSMTLTFLTPGCVKAGQGHRRSSVMQQFGGQSTRDRPAQAQSLGVEQFDGPPRRGKGALDPACEITDYAFVDSQLTVSTKFDDQSPEQLIVRRQQGYRWNGAEARAQVAQLDLKRRWRHPRRDQNESLVFP